MSRFKADLFLALAGLIWGFGFVAQKDAAAHIGPFTFVACRFLISAVFVLPLLRREGGFAGFSKTLKSGDLRKVIALCVAFVAAVTFQQCGIATTTVTNTAFLTGIYIVLVPFAAFFMYRQKISVLAVLASLLSFFGIWLLTGADPHHVFSGLNGGDVLVLICAVCFAVQVPMLGHVVSDLRMPFMLSFLQYMAVGLVTLLLALCFEHIDLHVIAASWLPIVYAGVASGGIAYTLQAIAQQHTPSVDSAIIMSSETLFGALGGVWLLHDRLTFAGYIGCALIMVAIILVELVPFLQKKRT